MHSGNILSSSLRVCFLIEEGTNLCDVSMLPHTNNVLYTFAYLPRTLFTPVIFIIIVDLKCHAIFDIDSKFRSPF